MGSGLFSTGRPAGEPVAVLVLRAVVAILSLAVLGLAALAISVSHAIADELEDDGDYSSGYNGTAALLIFVVAKTLLLYGVLTWLELRHPAAFLRILALLGWAISAIFWLPAWAWSASVASLWLRKYCDEAGECASADSNGRKEGVALAVCAGLGALIWVLCIAHLVLFFRACTRDTGSPAQTELGQVAGKEGSNGPDAFASSAEAYHQPHQPSYQPSYQPSQQHEQPPVYSR